MSARVSGHASLLLSSGNHTASIGWYAGVSFILHVLFFVILTYLPALAPQREFVPSVIMVNMVTMSPTGSIGKPGHPGPERPGPKADKPAAEEPKPAKTEVQESKPEPPAPKPAKPEVQTPKPEPPAPKPEKVSVPEPHPPKPEPVKAEPEKSADVISLSNEKPKIKTSLKKETFKSTQAIKNALNRIEKQVEETKPSDPVASALDRIKSKVEKTESETARSPSKEPASGSGKSSGGWVGGSGGGTGGTGGTGASGIQPIDFYRSLVPNHVENNWVFNEQLVGGRTDLVSVIVIKIMPNGEITDIWFEKKSGNSYFDDSVYKAVKKSNPLPPLPKEYTRPYYELGLIFTPKGLKRS
jgi:colicin import membrane protein